MKQLIRKAFRAMGYEIQRSPSTKHNRYIPFTHDPEKTLSFQSKLNEQTVKLHIGCGPRVLKGWINIDRYYVHYKEYLKYYTDSHYPKTIRGDISDFFAFNVITEPLPIPDNTIDMIFHEDFIEHLDQRGQILFLAETLRILKPSGIHRINTPELKHSMRSHSDFSQGFRGVYVEEWDKHKHLNVLTKSMLEEIATMVGYSRVIFNGRNQSDCNEIPREYRPDPKDRPEDGNLFADLYK